MIGNRARSGSLLVHLLAILLIVINLSSVEIAGFTRVLPLFDLMIIFYFAIFKRVFAIWFIFLLGVWGDALSGLPLGLSSICYIFAVKTFSALNHKLIIRENFVQIWQQFLAFSLMFLLLKWSLVSIFAGSLYSIINPTIQFILTGILYVLIHRVFDYLSEKIARNAEGY